MDASTGKSIAILFGHFLFGILFLIGFCTPNWRGYYCSGPYDLRYGLWEACEDQNTQTTLNAFNTYGLYYYNNGLYAYYGHCSLLNVNHVPDPVHHHVAQVLQILVLVLLVVLPAIPLAAGFCSKRPRDRPSKAMSVFFVVGLVLMFALHLTSLIVFGTSGDPDAVIYLRNNGWGPCDVDYLPSSFRASICACAVCLVTLLFNIPLGVSGTHPLVLLGSSVRDATWPRAVRVAAVHGEAMLVGEAGTSKAPTAPGMLQSYKNTGPFPPLQQDHAPFPDIPNVGCDVPRPPSADSYVAVTIEVPKSKKSSYVTVLPSAPRKDK